MCRPPDIRQVHAKKNGTHDVDDVDVFAPFVLFAFDPVAVEVGEEPVDVGSAGGVPVPLAGVVAEEGFVGQVGRLLKKRGGGGSA